MLPDDEEERPEAEIHTYWHPLPHETGLDQENEWEEPAIHEKDCGRLE